MTMMPTHAAIRISDPDPFGEVTLVPAAASGRDERELARAMAETVMEAGPGTASQALKRLRMMFPESPLTIRVAALNALMRR
jgi:hypothetical protein